ncbi:MAG: hypothetical protein AAF387_05970, partial [Pseudomonadota bacterium]
DFGIGFDLLRQHQGESDFALKSPAEVCFNFLGSTNMTQDSWRIASEPVTGTRAPNASRDYPLEVIAFIESAGLKIIWRFDNKSWKSDTIEKVSNQHLNYFNSLIGAQSGNPASALKGTHDGRKDALLAKLAARGN